MVVSKIIIAKDFLHTCTFSLLDGKLNLLVVKHRSLLLSPFFKWISVLTQSISFHFLDLRTVHMKNVYFFKDLYSTAPKRGSVFIGLMTPDGAI